MSAFGMVTRGMVPGPVTLLTLFSWSDYIVLNRGALQDLRTTLSYPPHPLELARSVAENAGRFGTHPISIIQRLFGIRRPYKVSRIRTREDLAFSKFAGISFRYFQFPDCKIRHGTPITDPNWPLDNEHDLQGRLLSAIATTVARTKAQVILAPWPYGPRQHLDHRLVNRAAARVADDTGVRLVYVDDIPYSRRPLEPTKDTRGCKYSPELLKLDPTEVKRKLHAMRIYKSQMIPGYFQAVYDAPPGSPEARNSETVWQQSADID
jgi:LmbE family N-acetylglucosaminyl deacetylase